MIDISLIGRIKLALLTALIFMLGSAFAQVVAPPPAVQFIVPLDIVALVQAVFTGIAAVGGVVAAIYAIWAKRKADQAAADAAAGVTKINAVSVQIDGLLAERDKAKVLEGKATEKQIAQDTAATLAEGQRQGRESVAGAVGAPPTGDGPLPVKDDRVAIASEMGAAALVKAAEAQTSLAKSAEQKK